MRFEYFISFPRSDGCETVLNNIENQIIKANTMKDNHLKLKQQIDTEVSIAFNCRFFFSSHLSNIQVTHYKLEKVS